MNPIIKECIKLINTENALNGEPFGKLCKSLLFPKRKRALVLNRDENLYYILSKEECINKEIRNFTELIAELLNVLDYLNNEHLIYFTNCEIREIEIFYECINKIDKTSIEGVCKCDNNIKLFMLDGQYKIEEQGVCVLLSSEGENVLYERLVFWFNQCIFPTTELTDFIKRGFITEEKEITKRSLRLSKRSLMLAYLVAILTPPITLFLGNKYGVTKIDEEQFSVLKTILEPKDTSSADTIKCDSIKVLESNFKNRNNNEKID